ncbi:hypothetical protein E1267_16480 [Nonomuraea longispora]|uniref:Uncharacterized protein n=1 Tax=Nonomuraea longispora TaxID=1848320 RepID=A0A4R4NHN0_9ACTN|nr:hypothetical protein E1267_16480 [Nonomuraea longispora]
MTVPAGHRRHGQAHQDRLQRAETVAADFRGRSWAACCATPGGRDDTWVLAGQIPAAAVHEAEQRLPGLTHGEGVWWSEPSGDRPAHRHYVGFRRELGINARGAPIGVHHVRTRGDSHG